MERKCRTKIDVSNYAMAKSRAMMDIIPNPSAAKVRKYKCVLFLVAKARKKRLKLGIRFRCIEIKSTRISKNSLETLVRYKKV